MNGRPTLEAIVDGLHYYAPVVMGLAILAARLLQLPQYEPQSSLAPDIAFSVVSIDVWAGMNKARGGHLVGAGEKIYGETLIVLGAIHVAMLFGVARLTSSYKSVWEVWVFVALLGYLSVIGLIAHATRTHLLSEAGN